MRCANCGHTWRQTAPPELDTDDNPAPTGGARTEPALDLPPRPGTIAAPRPENPLRVGFIREPPRRRRSRWAAIRWLALIVLFALAVLAGIVVARGAVTAIWPPAARFFSLAGLPVEPPATDLKVEKLAPARTADGLVIEGDIFNPEQSTRAVPPLRVALRDAADKEVQYKIFDPPAPQLAPGGVVHFKLPFGHPAGAATGVVVTFATR